MNGRKINKVVYTHNGILFSFKKKGILTHPTTWMNLDDTMPNEKIQSQKANAISFHPQEVPRVVKFTEAESRGPTDLNPLHIP